MKKIFKAFRFQENTDNEFQVGILNWISIIILWFGIAYSLYIGLLFDPKIITAIILLSVSTVLKFFKYDLGVKVVLGVMFLGAINLISFFPMKFFYTFGTNSLQIGFELILFGIAVLHIVTNKKSLSSLMNKEESIEEIEADRRLKIDAFKKRFSNRTLTELETTVANDDLLPEARKAAQELIAEMQS